MNLICSRCGEQKPEEAFSVDTRWARGYASWCKECAAEDQRIRRRNNPEYTRRVNVKHKYGLTVDEYDQLLSKPCAICGLKAETLDHNHKTGKIRAGLCKRCNIAIGLLQDDSVILRAAADYLDGHEEKEEQ
jgi:hypothetical protein